MTMDMFVAIIVDTLPLEHLDTLISKLIQAYLVKHVTRKQP